MKSLCDLCVVVPSDNMQIIEDLHLSIAHSVFACCGTKIQAMDHSRATIALAQPVFRTRAQLPSKVKPRNKEGTIRENLEKKNEQRTEQE